MSKTSILVIEDDPAILQGLKDLLQLENYEVSISSDGEQGTGMAIQNQPDLILLDINLPSLNGFDVCRKLRENSYINPIIMLTARGESIDRVVGLELGANDYITKPFNSHELLARIHSNLRSTERLTRKIRKPFTGERKLLAVMFTDMKDYALKMNTNEKLALKLLEIHNQLVKEIVETNHGKIVEIIGDAFVVTFESAVKAVECAYEIQKKLNKYNDSEAPDHQMEIRIGIHAGDVIEFENNIKGDTVNIAARIQQAAKPGSIFLSRNVYDTVKSKVKLNFHFLGKFKFKNIVEPVKLYKINL